MRQAFKIYHRDAQLPKNWTVTGQGEDAAFTRFGGTAAATVPVLFTVPHAGHRYPEALARNARAGVESLRVLEDRHADCLVQRAVEEGYPAIVVDVPRAFIDLNRHPDEIDTSSVRDMPRGAPSMRTAKLRGGLGLVPSRYHSIGELWRERPSYADVRDRIEAIHAPFHSHVADMLRDLDSSFGGAVLIDVHSMPPLPPRPGGAVAEVIIGDRFGQSADPALAEIAIAVTRAHGFSVAHNVPYAGGYTLDRHSRPRVNRHALQIEFDRSLYLDSALAPSGPQVAACQALLCALAEALGGAVVERRRPLAAE